MRYNILSVLFFLGISTYLNGQIADSSLNVHSKSKEIELINSSIMLEQIKNKTNFNQDIKSLIQYQQKAVQEIQEAKSILAPLPLIKDESEQDNAAMSLTLIAEPDESEFNKKRLLTGPSQFDSRIELRNLNPLIDWQKQILTNASSVAVIIEKDMMHQLTDSIFQLDISSSLGNLYNLCPGEAFRDQPVIGIGTSFIIDEKSMITAAHVFTRPLKNYVIVFGFEMVNKVGAYEAFINIKDIYYPQFVINELVDLDVKVFSVDRSFDRPILKWSKSSLVSNNASVYMIGHPVGLPKKVALNASMKNNINYNFFYTSLDAFQGNSGSPVFRFETNEVIGILVSGELDFKWNGSCNASTLCSIPYCKGEKVIRIEEIMNGLNQR